MTVFKAFLRVLWQCKAIVLLYTVILVCFAAFQMQTEQSSIGFLADRPDILLVNQDTAEEEGKDCGLSAGLVSYLMEYCEVADITGEDAINDALFYRDISYIVTIPRHYSEEFFAYLRGETDKKPAVEVRSTGDQEASYAEMLLSRYLRVARVYGAYAENGKELANRVAETLSGQVSVEVASHLDTGGLSKAAFFYNFLNYSLLAGCIYVICLVLASFREEKIRKRTMVSSMNYRTFNRILLLSNGLFAVGLWMIYVLLSLVLVGEVLLSDQGVWYLANSFAFLLCALTMAFLFGTLVKNKNAVNGIVNVVALGSSFLCGAFVPVQMLPKSVLWIAHILPSYWYIQTNEYLKRMETVSPEALRPVLGNMGILLGFALLFIIAANGVSKRTRQIG